MEKRINELRGLDKEARQLVLHRGIDEIILVRGNLEVLFQLRREGSVRHYSWNEGRRDYRVHQYIGSTQCTTWGCRGHMTGVQVT